MSTLVLDRLPGEPRRRKGFFRPLIEFLDGVRLARAMAHRYDVLSRLSDVELAARGIERQDIPRLVVEGKYD
jgi:hypothetical protein